MIFLRTVTVSGLPASVDSNSDNAIKCFDRGRLENGVHIADVDRAVVREWGGEQRGNRSRRLPVFVLGPVEIGINVNGVGRVYAIVV